MQKILQLGLLAIFPAIAAAQSRDSLDARDTESARTIVVRETAAPMTVDGRLDEAAWASADSIVNLRQRYPQEGAPASELTVVKILRDNSAIYVGARMYDRDPSGIRATQLRRDADLGSDDQFGFIIDSFHDRRGAFVFNTNPNGAMYDAQQTGSENTNVDWNGIWDVAVSRDSAGWTAEFRIPFRTLRFNAGAGSSFGFNARRFVRRRNEEDLWQGWKRTEGIYQFSAEGELTGLGVLTRAHSVELKPYALVRADAPQYTLSGARSNGSSSAKFGADLKTSVTPTLTADFTVNTDFAQADADRQIVNLSRFPLFFPEKREFFLESNGIFSFGTSGRVQPFYSRRIGLGYNGSPVPIIGGARLTGKSGPWAIGLLDARTGGSDAASDAVVRVKHDLFDRSYFGAILTNRSGPGVRGSQSTAGLDLDLPLVLNGKNMEPSFWMNGTRTPGISGTPLAWRAGFDYPNDRWDNFASLYHVSAGYNPALGFVRRTGILETTGHVDYIARPATLGIRSIDVEAIPSWDIIADEHGSLGNSKSWQTAEFEWLPVSVTMQTGDYIELNVRRDLDAPTEAFTIFPGVTVPGARYWWTRYEAHYRTSAGRPLSVHPSANFGSYYGGHIAEGTFSFTYRGGGHLILSGDFDRSQARIPAGKFTAVSTGGTLEYAFTTRANFIAFAQYNDADRRADFNLRFHWIPVIGDDLFIVWNSGYSTDPLAAYRFGRVRSLTHALNGGLVIKGVHRLAY